MRKWSSGQVIEWSSDGGAAKRTGKRVAQIGGRELAEKGEGEKKMQSGQVIKCSDGLVTEPEPWNP
jgi:hypothetical protein